MDHPEIFRSQKIQEGHALTGEFLARELFKASFLLDPTILETVATLDRFRGGFKIVTADDGSFLNPGDFDAACRRGNFQNGGSEWLFNLMSQKLGEDCGLPHDPIFWQQASEDLDETHDTESIQTDCDESTLSWDRSREYNAWNALGRKLIKEAHAKQLVLVS